MRREHRDAGAARASAAAMRARSRADRRRLLGEQRARGASSTGTTACVSALTLYGERTLSSSAIHAGCADRVAQPHAGHADLRQRAHDDEVGKLEHARQERRVGERVVRLVDDDERPARRARMRSMSRAANSVPVGLFGIREPDERGPVARDRGQHRVDVEREVRAQRHADEAQVREVRVACGTSRTTDPAPARRRPGLATAAVMICRISSEPLPSTSAASSGSASARRSAAFDLVAAAVGIAVDARVGHRGGDLRARLAGQPVRVLHRVELDHARRLGDRVGASARGSWGGWSPSRARHRVGGRRRDAGRASRSSDGASCRRMYRSTPPAREIAEVGGGRLALGRRERRLDRGDRIESERWR